MRSSARGRRGTIGEPRTSIWGFALGCLDDDDEDTCGCEVEERAGCQIVQLSGVDQNGDWFGTYLFVLEDGTFYFEATPGLEYVFTSGRPYELTTESGPVTRLVLQEGEVVFARLIVPQSC